MKAVFKFFQEIKRRKMYKPLAVYASFAFITLQVTDVVFSKLFLPEWTGTFVVVLVLLGFPITFIFSWAFDITPDGIEKTLSIANGEKKPSKIILPITGFLTLVGVGFWIVYSMVSLSSADDIDIKIGIKKSIAILNFENFTGQKPGDYFCSGLSETIRASLAKLGKLDVKSRFASLKMKNQGADNYELDYFIEGSLSDLGEYRQLNIGLVSAQTGNNIWTNQYKFTSETVGEYQDSILNNILTALDIEPPSKQFSENKSNFHNTHTFKLLGEGIYHFDNKNFQNAFTVFDSILKIEPNNLTAQFHKANTQFQLEKYSDALNIYRTILTQSEKINHVDWKWEVPNRKNLHHTFSNEHIVLVRGKNLAIIFLEGKNNGLLFALDLVTQQLLWENFVPDKWIESLEVINDLVFLTSIRTSNKQLGEPALFAFDITNGGSVFEKEFPRKSDNQVVIYEILENYNEQSKDFSTTLLYFKKGERNSENIKQLTLINNTTGAIIWSSALDITTWGTPSLNLRTVGGDTWLEILTGGSGKLIVLNNKTGIPEQDWTQQLSNECQIESWGQKLVSKNCDDNIITLWNPNNQKTIWKYNPKNKIRSVKRLDTSKDMPAILLTNLENGDLNAINIDGGLFNWKLERWSQKIGVAEKIWFSQNDINRVYCLTKSDTLFTIRLDDGKIIERLATDRHDYTLYFDDLKNSIVLVNSQYIMGIDPLNGEQLWKIKDVDISSKYRQYNISKKILLNDNSIFVAKLVPADSSLIVNNYNRDNGNLIGSETIPVALLMINWVEKEYQFVSSSFSLLNELFPFELMGVNQAPLILLPDRIIQFNARFENDSHIEKKLVQLQAARSLAANGEIEQAIKEYHILIDNYDQMNQAAYWELAEIYQNKSDAKKAIVSLMNFYDLILPTSHEGIKTIQKLKELSGLRWEKSIYWDEWDIANIAVDGRLIFRFLQNKIETYRMSSGTLIWEMFLDDNSSLGYSDVTNKNYMFVIEIEKPNEKAIFDNSDTLDFTLFKKNKKYNLLSLNKKTGETEWSVPINIVGESQFQWMKNDNKMIFFQSINESFLTLSAHYISNGLQLWEIQRDISSLYGTYNLQPAFYNNNLLLPLDNTIEYININTGNVNGVFADEDIEQIFFFNEHSVQNNSMLFGVEDIDYEYYVVDIDKKVKIDGGEFESENPQLSHWFNNTFYDIALDGKIIAYQSYLNDYSPVSKIWVNNYGSNQFFAGISDENLYILNTIENNLLTISGKTGAILESIPLLWLANKIKIKDDYIMVQSKQKLYVISN